MYLHPQSRVHYLCTFLCYRVWRIHASELEPETMKPGKSHYRASDTVKWNSCDNGAGDSKL